MTAFCDRVAATLPGFAVEIREGRVRLVHVFRAQLWGATREPQDLKTLTYTKLIQLAEEADVETELCFA